MPEPWHCAPAPARAPRRQRPGARASTPGLRTSGFVVFVSPPPGLPAFRRHRPGGLTCGPAPAP
eukprot:11184296-Lingulodinium_polyedra.AAC.1